MRRTYEADDEAFPAVAYVLNNRRDVAWWVLGWETAPDEDTEWDGIDKRTGKVVICMVGDDSHSVCDEKDLTPISEDDYCGGCGQIGCKAYAAR